MDEAQAAFARALQLDPDFVPAYVNYADLLRVTGHDQQAAELLAQGISKVPASAALHHALGLTEARMQQRMSHEPAAPAQD